MRLLLLLNLASCARATPGTTGIATMSTFTVQDAAGVPIESARAVVVDHYYELVAGTAARPLMPDASGRFQYEPSEHNASDADLRLVWARGYNARRVEADGSTITLERASSVRGRLDVTEADGAEVGVVWLSSTDDAANWPFFVRCDVDEDGRFVAHGLSAGSYRIVSRPLGSAPSLAADVNGNLRFLSADHFQLLESNPLAYRLITREIEGDGTEHLVRVAFGQAEVCGRVLDEEGQPIGGAVIEGAAEFAEPTSTTTAEDDGTFTLAIPPSPHMMVRATHPDFGAQWTNMDWRGWLWADAGPPETAIELVLRRGVVLHGKLTDGDAPLAGRRLILIPAYMGSGPATIETTTDDEGNFTFERALLSSFELVVDTLSNWPIQAAEEPGNRARVVGLNREELDSPQQLRVEAYETVERQPVMPGVEPGTDVRVWLRRANGDYRSFSAQVDQGRRIQIVMEAGVPYELWVGSHELAPWAGGVAPDWAGRAREMPARLNAR